MVCTHHSTQASNLNCVFELFVCFSLHRWKHWSSFFSYLHHKQKHTNIHVCIFLLDVCLFSPSLPDLQGPGLVIPIHRPAAELWIPIPCVCHSSVPRGHGSPGPGGPLQRPSAIHLSEDWTTGKHQQGHCANHKDTMVTEWPSVCCCHPCTFCYLFHSDCCYHSVLRHKVKKRDLFYNAAHYILLSHNLKVILFSCFYKTRHLEPALGLMQTFSATLKCLLVGIGWHMLLKCKPQKYNLFLICLHAVQTRYGAGT